MQCHLLFWFLIILLFLNYEYLPIYLAFYLLLSQSLVQFRWELGRQPLQQHFLCGFFLPFYFHVRICFLSSFALFQFSSTEEQEASLYNSLSFVLSLSLFFYFFYHYTRVYQWAFYFLSLFQFSSVEGHGDNTMPLQWLPLCSFMNVFEWLLSCFSSLLKFALQNIKKYENEA